MERLEDLTVENPPEGRLEGFVVWRVQWGLMTERGAASSDGYSLHRTHKDIAKYSKSRRKMVDDICAEWNPPEFSDVGSVRKILVDKKTYDQIKGNGVHYGSRFLPAPRVEMD